MEKSVVDCRQSCVGFYSDHRTEKVTAIFLTDLLAHNIEEDRKSRMELERPESVIEIVEVNSNIGTIYFYHGPTFLYSFQQRIMMREGNIR